MIGPDGRMTAEGFEGLSAAEAQAAVVAALREQGLLRAEQPYATRSRPATAGQRIEPLVSPQWLCRWGSWRSRRSRRWSATRCAITPDQRNRFALDWLEGDPSLVRLAPALVGPPDPDLYLRRLRGDDRRRAPARALRRLWRGAAQRGGRARHLVLLGALAVRDARLARRHAGARALLPEQRPHHGARDHPPLGEPDDLLGALPARRGPLPRRDHTSTVLRARRAADVEEPRHRDRPARGGRRARRRRDALRPAGDLLDPGRPLHPTRRSRRAASWRASSGTSPA